MELAALMSPALQVDSLPIVTPGEPTHFYTYSVKEGIYHNYKGRQEVLLNEQCLIVEENNKRGKTRDLFRKIENIKGVSSPKMGTIKDKNGRDLVDAKEIQKRWKEYMEELYKNRS